MDHVSAPSAKFIFHDLRKINGYLDPADALLFVSILEAQGRNSFSGGIAEIGVFYGRSFFLLKRLARVDEKVLAIDLFDIGRVRDGKTHQLRMFLENGRNLGLPVDEELVIVGDSTKLVAADIIRMTGRLRFFSVDGGHNLRHVEADSLLACETLADFGVIAFDDTFNPEWPEVTVGVTDFLRAKAGQFVAFCISNKKTYVCRHDFSALYRSAVLGSPHLRRLDVVDKVELLGSCAVRVHHPLKRRVLYELLVRSGASALSHHVYA
jgi:hypothetical protein